MGLKLYTITGLLGIMDFGLIFTRVWEASVGRMILEICLQDEFSASRTQILVLVTVLHGVGQQ